MNFSSRNIDDSGITQFIDLLLKSSSPVVLNLFDNKITDKGFEELTDVIKIISIPITLILSQNLITCEGAEKFASLTKKASVPISLDLSYNQIGNSGAIHFANAIKEASVPISLDLSYNQISNSGAIHFANAIKEAFVPISLDLSGNSIEYSTLGYFENAIKEASVPISLELGDNANMEPEDYNGIISAMNDNFVIEASHNPNVFMGKIKEEIRFINQNLPIIPLNIAHPVFSIDKVSKKIADFLGELEIATINIKAIKEVGASVDNKYSSINYNMLNSINHRLIKFGEIAEENDSILKRVNQNIDFFLRKLFLPNKYQEMQSLANKYEIKIRVKDERDFKNIYKKIVLETHPDKTIGSNKELRTEMQEDFMKANSLLKQDTTASSEIYKPIMGKLYKANLFIKVADTSIDIIKGLINPTLKSSLKISIDCIQLSAMYYDSYSVMLPIIGIGALYQIYNADYEGAVKSVITSAGIMFMSTAIYTTTPALSITLTAGFTGYAGFTMLKSGYELYNEWQEYIELTNNLEHEKILEEDIFP